MLANIDGEEFRILSESEHPTNDPIFPCYLSDDIKAVNEDLEFSFDMLAGRSAWISLDRTKINGQKLRRYLPQFEEEDQDDYRSRYTQTLWTDLISSSFDSISGHIAQVGYLPSLFSGIINKWGNINNNGVSLPAFMSMADSLVLRDHLCLIQIEMPKQIKRFISSEDLLENGESPYLKIIERKNIVGFKFDQNNLQKIVTKEYVSLDTGSFENEMITQYRVFNFDGSYSVYILVIDPNDREKKIFAIEIDAGLNTLKKFPFVFYCSDFTNVYYGRSPLWNLLEMQLEYYQLKSKDQASLHLTNFPMYIRTGMIRPGMQAQKVHDNSLILPGRSKTISPSRMQDLPENGKIDIIAPPDTCAQINENRMKTIRDDIKNSTLEFLGQSLTSAPKTATQTVIEYTALGSRIEKLRNQKSIALNNIETLWCEYYKLKPEYQDTPSNFTISLNSANSTLEASK